MKLIIVGGVAGGASAAARARRLDEEAEIVLFERGPDVSFANCGLPYYIGGEIAERGRLLVTTAEQLTRRLRIDVRTRTNVEAIDRQAKTVSVQDLATGRRYDESYDKLILAPGAAPIRPPLPGIDLAGVHVLRNLEDADKIKQAVDAGCRAAVVVGAGMIGLELVENLIHRGVACHLVELQDQILPVVDREMTAPLVETLTRSGVGLYLSRKASAIESSGNRLSVVLDNGQRLDADLVILGVGVRPENSLAAAAGLELGSFSGVRVNEAMQTSDPDIFAVGDVVETMNYVTGQPGLAPLAGPANRQGRIAADQVFGRGSRFRGFQATAIARVFELTVAATGASEKALQRQGRSYRTVYIHPAHHASYFPNAKPMTLKLVFDPADGRILGAQGVGAEGIDKRIDVLAVAIQARMTVFDLAEVELAYAPPYGSAKDPINMLGFVAGGLLQGDHPQIGAAELLGELNLSPEQRPWRLIDVRTPEEFAAGAIEGAINIPVDEVRSRIGEFDRERPIVAYCQVGRRGYLATRILLAKGFSARNLSGGYKTYRLFRPTE